MFKYLTLNNLLTIIKQLADIGVVWLLFYYLLKIVKNNSRTIQIFKGILVIVIAQWIAGLLGLHTVETLAATIMNWGPLAIIIIFQPEIRNILEKIGKTNVFSPISTLTLNERENLVEELVKACTEMSKTKTGALISLEQGHSLSDYIKTGTPMNSVVSSELLCSIFQYGTPLHDGAVIIQGVKIACAAAYFPPTTRELPTSYGARHRAAVGISEITDSVTIIVSEETGNISIAQGGKLSVISPAHLHDFLMMIVCQKRGDEVKGEKDVQKEALKESIEANDGKKPGVFAHYFKGKNKRSTKSKDTPENKFTKSKKEDSVDVLQSENVVVDSEIEKLGIADLVETQTDAPLDQLFETIVVDAAKDDEKTQPKKEDGKEEAPKPKKRGRPKKKKDDTEEKDVKETKPKAKSKGRKKKDEFMDDILEAQEIIFDDGSADSSSKKDKEGRK
ncbi:diadenylate cyclase CdaA [[Eubacterium] hominis]|uniref:diadenylate cyclase CdaA n=1 Tax=[Eubacterium] hominis TaxID=2764325 RepID=UPI0022E2A7DB